VESQALFENAVALACRALDAPDVLRDEARFDLLLRVAAAEDTLSHVEHQEAHAREALTLADRLGGARHRARAHHAIGVAHVARSELDSAVRELERAAELAREADDLAVEGAVTNALGNVLAILTWSQEARRRSNAACSWRVRSAIVCWPHMR
jgi:hypothetical protein